ncbi:hypothetical protein [Hydrogenophaga sp.]|uniref:hypothetical protein n=1 Tax=Hydrogenophaga sp. TaxID=1904254 RepID=UPI0027188325|nr:hypothetical protein [Hydrogenophaga sp.]MDO9434878.1 hypothetical protein [Hydrogenophaga sp.]
MGTFWMNGVERRPEDEPVDDGRLLISLFLSTLGQIPIPRAVDQQSHLKNAAFDG